MTTRIPRETNGHGRDEGVAQLQPRRSARETAENSPAAEVMGIRVPREARQERQERSERIARVQPREQEEMAETAAMSVPPKNRWQVLMVEYELLDSSIAQIMQRVWMSGLVLISLSLAGMAYLSVTLKPGLEETLRIIGLMGGVGSVLALAWWVMERRMFTAQRVAEYRRDEIERELGLRSGLYMTFLRQSRRLGSSRDSALARQMSEGDDDLQDDLKDLALSPAGKSSLPAFFSDRTLWSLVPWLLTLAWIGLYVVKM